MAFERRCPILVFLRCTQSPLRVRIIAHVQIEGIEAICALIISIVDLDVVERLLRVKLNDQVRVLESAIIVAAKRRVAHCSVVAVDAIGRRIVPIKSGADPGERYQTAEGRCWRR